METQTSTETSVTSVETQQQYQNWVRRMRHLAKRKRLQLVAYRARDERDVRYGCFMIVNADTGIAEVESISGADLEKYLTP